MHSKEDILVARCGYFRAIFGSNMRESQEGVTFVLLLEYLYTDVLLLTREADVIKGYSCCKRSVCVGRYVPNGG